jgi:hypothetical protein
MSSSPKEPSNCEFYSTFGTPAERSWEDAVQYDFICGGGGAFYSARQLLFTRNFCLDFGGQRRQKGCTGHSRLQCAATGSNKRTIFRIRTRTTRCGDPS